MEEDKTLQSDLVESLSEEITVALSCSGFKDRSLRNDVEIAVLRWLVDNRAEITKREVS